MCEQYAAETSTELEAVPEGVIYSQRLSPMSEYVRSHLQQRSC